MNLNLPSYVASGTVKSIVTTAVYDSADNSIHFECNVPVRSGEMTTYPFYWPASLDETSVFPTPEDVAIGNAGKGGLTQAIGGVLPIGYTGVIGVPGVPINWRGSWDGATAYHVNDAVLFNGSFYLALNTSVGIDPGNDTYWQIIVNKVLGNAVQGGTVFIGGPNIIYMGNTSQGDRTPGDVGFAAQPVLNKENARAGQQQHSTVRRSDVEVYEGLPRPDHSAATDRVSVARHPQDEDF